MMNFKNKKPTFAFVIKTEIFRKSPASKYFFLTVTQNDFYQVNNIFSSYSKIFYLKNIIFP